jgi:hypothetical protein
MKMLKYLWNRWLAHFNQWPSWVIVYPDGHSRALRYDDAVTRCKMFGGIRVVYGRDHNGDLIRFIDNPTQ